MGVGYGFQAASEILTPPPPPPPPVLPLGVLQAIPLAVGSGPGGWGGGLQQAPGAAVPEYTIPGGPKKPVATPAAHGAPSQGHGGGRYQPSG